MNPIVHTRPHRDRMGREEARRFCERVKAHLGDARSALLELHEREGWRALGYASWRECVVEEFSLSQSRVYQLLDAARVERDLAVSTGVENLPEKALRPLAGLDSPEERRQAWRDAAAASSRPTPSAAEVAEAVRKLREALPAEDQAEVARRRDAEHVDAGRAAQARRDADERRERVRRGIRRLRQAAKAFRRVPDAADVVEDVERAAGKAQRLEGSDPP